MFRVRLTGRLQEFHQCLWGIAKPQKAQLAASIFSLGIQKLLSSRTME
jgi:hypothetical protein